jgi:transposase-like protein
MPAKRRKFTEEEKQQILNEAELSGISQALHKYKLSYSVFHRWKEKQQQDNAEKSSPDAQSQSTIKKLLEENATLKKIIANQALKIELQEEKISKQNKSNK